MIKKVFLTVSMFFMLALPACAATLSTTPRNGQTATNQPIRLRVILSTSDQAANAVSGTLHFPSSLRIVSISKANSIISLWPTEPSFSNENDTVHFEGVILNPGYQGQAGTVLSVTFVGSLLGDNDILFSQASVLANDGQGTEILKGMSGSHLSIVKAIKQVTPTAISNASSTLATTSEPSQTHAVNQIIVEKNDVSTKMYSYAGIGLLVVILVAVVGIINGSIFYIPQKAVREFKHNRRQKNKR